MYINREVYTWAKIIEVRNLLSEECYSFVVEAIINLKHIRVLVLGHFGETLDNLALGHLSPFRYEVISQSLMK